ncbi:MAG: hypothetical protein HFF90_07695 [Oscillibacter sp.]|nr:hypothetical protein [Oscillibacter sp.]
MRKLYRTIEDVLNSPWAAAAPSVKTTDRVLRSTKLEDSIYKDLRAGDGGLDQIEQDAEKKLHSFPALSRDIFQTFYSLMPRKNEAEPLSASARKFNAPILDHVTQSEDFPTLKSVCEGREFPAYEAAAEFISRTAGELDGLLSDIGGDKGGLNTLEKLEAAEKQAQEELSNLLDMLRRTPGSKELEQSVIKVANQAESKRRQVEAVGKMIDASAAGNQEAISALVAQAVQSATEKAEEVQAIIGAWSDEPGNLERNEVNEELLAQVRKSDVLKSVAKYLGRFREIFAQGKRNGYAYGRGEKYSLELGNDISKAITSELAMLASPKTMPLFLQKYQRKQIKQYQRREPVYKGMGDIICCLDESGSTYGDPAAWGKAVALTLLEIAADGGRNFALIHFSDSGDFKTDLFRPGAYTMADKMKAAETFLNGGTDFETPMQEALRLMRDEGFENADIVFITDGQCGMPEHFLTELRQEQMERRFTVTGVLLDSDYPGIEFSLKPFCQNIYRTSELAGEDIIRELVSKRV